MEKNKLIKQNNQLQINFERIEIPKVEISLSAVTCNSVNSNTAKIISISQGASFSKHLKENELRNFVLQNTKSF